MTCIRAVLILALGSLGGVGSSHGQEGIVVEEGELIDQQPFDLITLTDEAGSASVKVFPIPFPGRQLPASPKPTDKLQVTLLQFPDRRYEVAWKAIEKIGLFEQRIYEEALEKMNRKDFIGAFQNLSFLMKNYPEMPNLENLRQQFLFDSAIERYQAGELQQTLSALEELRATAPGFKPQPVLSAMSRVASTLIEELQKKGDLGSAKKMIARLKSTHGVLPAVKEWEDKIEAMALAKKSEALRLFEQKRYREARDAASEMLSIYPELPDGPRLLEEINNAHPMVRVGVMQQAQELDPASLVSWPARRAGKLVYQPIFQFLATGTEGGSYGFALGRKDLSDDRQQLILTLDPSIQSSLSAFGLAQTLVQRAEPGSSSYDPSWAAVFKSVEATAGNQVIVNLKRPYVLPHALLQWILPDAPGAAGSLPGQYEMQRVSETENVFNLRASVERHGQPVEIIEVFYSDPKQAVNDLLKGEVDLIDQLYPADARRLAADSRLRVGAYALPTTHMLIPVSKDNPYLAKDKFRRALLYATDRKGMLTGELLNSENLSDGRLISGPFPLGENESDPLAYAYNTDIQPTPNNPQLAKLLLVMVEKELETAAKKAGEETPKREKLVVGCPDYEFARVAVQAMIQQWAIIGIEAEMKILSLEASQDTIDACDLVYVITTMWEPATDIERLLGGNGIATTDNPFIVQGLERLRAARNWREVRDAMQDLHRMINYHLPLLPLWQVSDRFVVRRTIEGVSDHPLSLYQDVENWRLKLGGTSR